MYELLPRDGADNSGEGLLVRDSSGNFVQAGNKLVALLGVKDLIVIDTPTRFWWRTGTGRSRWASW